MFSGGCRRDTRSVAGAASDFQPLLAHAIVAPQIRRRALEDDAAVAHHVHPTRNGQRDGELLLDEQDRDAALRSEERRVGEGAAARRTDVQADELTTAT